MEPNHNLTFRAMSLSEADQIREIDAKCYVRNAWRVVESNQRQLVRIDWTDTELPNGTNWHIDRYRSSLAQGGKAIGCFDHDVLVGYAVVDSAIFGTKSKYSLLDQIFVSRSYRGKGIGKQLFRLACEAAGDFGADKLYICAGSSEETIAFYFGLGCSEAAEINSDLAAEDPNDWQLEFRL